MPASPVVLQQVPRAGLWPILHSSHPFPMPQSASLFIVACMFFTACSAPAPQEAPPIPAQDTIAQQPIHDPGMRIPSRYSAVWALPDTSRWLSYWRQQYTDSTGDLRQRTADLDGDGTLDHALFLCRKDTARHDSAYALIIAFGDQRDTVLDVSPWAEAEGGIGMGLALEPPGVLHHLGGEEGGEPEGSVKLEHPAVTLLYFEKASITWYWRDGTFHKVWTGD